MHPRFLPQRHLVLLWILTVCRKRTLGTEDQTRPKMTINSCLHSPKCNASMAQKPVALEIGRLKYVTLSLRMARSMWLYGLAETEQNAKHVML